MPTTSATITFNPTGDAWSITLQPIKVTPGTTTISWDIELAEGATGSIAFDTSNGHPGIKFGTDWPGTEPTGTSASWSVDVTDAIQPGSPSQTYEYTVNALYTAQGSSTGQRKSWDPAVEMDPPSVVI